MVTAIMYLVEQLSRLYLCEECEVYDGHLSGHLLRVKVEDGEEGRRIRGNLQE